MKAIVLSCIFAVVVAAVTVDGFQDQTRIIGTIQQGDRMLDQRHAFANRVFGRNVLYKYNYPRWGWGKTISCIKVIDMWRNGTNGDLYLNGGGVGYRSVSMTLQSKISYGIQYHIEVWGR